MSYWFYQVNPQNWDPQRFRMEIWENERWSWDVSHAVMRGQQPKPGDSVAFYCTEGQETDFLDAGFFGWAVILEWHENSRTLYFRPVAPTNHLKMYPWGNDEARKVADKVRGAMKQGTLWLVGPEEWQQIRTGITTWLVGRASEMSSSKRHAT